MQHKNYNYDQHNINRKSDKHSMSEGKLGVPVNCRMKLK